MHENIYIVLASFHISRKKLKFKNNKKPIRQLSVEFYFNFNWFDFDLNLILYLTVTILFQSIV